MGLAAKVSFSRRVSALFVYVLLLGGAAPLHAQGFRFPWDAPERRPPVSTRLSAQEVRAILAREGAHMVGSPRAVHDEWIAIGRDSAGQGKKYILDATSGEVLAILDFALPEKPKRRERSDEPTSPGAPPPPPAHADDLGAPPPAPPAAKADSGVNTSAPAPSKPDPADAALSPIRPMRPVGAPKVEPLPQ